MILVTLGTQDKSFIRLLNELQKCIDEGVIKDRVVVQAGFTKFESKDMEVFDYVSVNEFCELMTECSILITHGGVGSIMEGLRNNKKVIAVPRLKRYKEHTNDHQKQIINSLDKDGHIIGVKKLSELEDALKKVVDFKPKKYNSNRSNFVDLIRKKINNI